MQRFSLPQASFTDSCFNLLIGTDLEEVKLILGTSNVGWKTESRKTEEKDFRNYN